MPFCPKCKNEYREGFRICAECKCELVDSLEALKEQAVYPKEEVQQDAFASAAALKDEFAQKSNGSGVRPRDGYKSGIYRNNAERAEDNKSSAWTLLTVGVVGIILLVLVMAGVIPVYFYGVTRFMVYGVMFALFILFIVMGMVSLRNSRIFAKRAESDSTLSDTMHNWCKDNLNAADIDAQVFSEEESGLAEEMKYFKRIEYIKSLLSDKFMNLDEGFLEDFVDHIYSEIFEE